MPPADWNLEGMTLSDWELAQRPLGWPYIRISRFDLPPRPQIDTIFGMAFPEDDPTDASYSKDDSDETDDSDDLETSSDIEDDPNEEDGPRIKQEDTYALPIRNEMGSQRVAETAESQMSISKAEIDDIVADNMDIDRTRLSTNEAELAELELAEAEAAASYNADRIASLMNDFYDLLIRMGHWPAEAVSKAPHTPSIDVELGKHLGYDERVLELMGKLPYINEEWNKRRHFIVPFTRMADYRDRRHLIANHTHDPWILPLTLPSEGGMGIYLNTKLGTIVSLLSTRYRVVELCDRVYMPPPGSDKPGTIQYRRRHFITTDEFFLGCVEAYTSLEVLPIIVAEDNNPEEWNGPVGQSKLAANVFYRELRDCQQALLSLYKEFGWPSNFRRAEFLKKWRTTEAFIKEKYKIERMELGEADQDESDG